MGNRLRICRTDRRLKQEDVAKAIGVSRAAYCHWETGRRELPTDMLTKIADFYQCSTDELLGSRYYYVHLAKGEDE